MNEAPFSRGFLTVLDHDLWTWEASALPLSYTRGTDDRIKVSDNWLKPYDRKVQRSLQRCVVPSPRKSEIEPLGCAKVSDGIILNSFPLTFNEAGVFGRRWRSQRTEPEQIAGVLARCEFCSGAVS